MASRNAPPIAPTDPLIGVELGNYRVEEKIAEGGMGLIYRAVHTVIGRQAAIKVLTQRYSDDQNMIKRLHREARAVNRIGHPNIVDIFDFGRTPDDRQYFAMEYLAGESLAQIIERQGALPWSFTSQVLAQALDAIAAAHDLGIVHRDIKPENILVVTDDDGAVTTKVLDFGIAKSVGVGPEGEQLTRAGSVMGTPEYIAPEQIRGKQVDGRADLYAMGVILYEMITGRRPYNSDKVMNLLMSHLRDPIPPLGQVDPQLGVPQDALGAVPKAMSKAADDRFQDARSFARALGLTTSAVTSGDGTRPLPDMFWEMDVSQNTGELTGGSHPTAPRGMVATGTGGGRLAATEAQLPTADAGPRRSPLIWIAPLALILLSGVAIAFVALRGGKPTTLGGKGSGSGSAATVGSGNGSASAATKPTFAPVKNLDDLLFRVRKALREGLASPKELVRARALRGLGDLHDKDARRKLLKVLKTDPNPIVQAAAARALAQLGETDVKADLQGVRDEVSDVVRVAVDDALRRLHDPAGRRGLRKALKSKKEPVRVAAALALAEADDKSAMKVLEPMLARSNSKLLGPTLAALAQLQHKKALKSLREGLTKGDTSTRLQFAEALAKLGDESAISTLEALLKKGELPVRLVAAKNLATLGDYAGLEVMKRGAVDKAPQTRMLAADALGAVADRAALPPLAQTLGDARELVKMASAASLARILALMPTKLLRRSQDWLLAALAQNDWSARHAAVGVSAELDPELAIELLGWAFRDKDERVRLAAVRQMAKLAPKSAKARRYVVSALFNDKSAKVRAEAARGLGRIGDAQAKKTLEQAVRDLDRGVGMAIAGSLLSMGNAKYLRALLAAAKAKKASTRARALSALANWKNAKRRNKLLRRSLADRSLGVRLAAALGLATNGSRAGVKVLEKIAAKDKGERGARALAALVRLSSPKKRVRLLARSKSARSRRIAMSSAVSALGAAGAVPLLRRGARDDNVGVRRAAAKGLASIARQRPSITGLLHNLARDPDASVRAAAAVGLSKLEAKAASKRATVKVAPVKASPEPAAPKIPTKPKARKGTKPNAGITISFVEDTKKEASYKSLMGRAEIQLRSGRYRAALSTLSRARRVGKNRAPPLFDTGKVLLKMAIRAKQAGKKRRARKHMRNARRFFKRYLRKAPRGKQAKKARDGLSDVRRLLRAVR